RAFVGAVPPAELARSAGDRVRGMDGDSRDRVPGRTLSLARAEVFLGDDYGRTVGPTERRSAGTAVTRPGRPVQPERRGLLKPERNDWSLTMASAFPTRGHDIGHSIWVHDRAVGSIILLPVPAVQYYVDRIRQAKTSREIVTRNRHTESGAWT